MEPHNLVIEFHNSIYGALFIIMELHIKCEASSRLLELHEYS